MARRTYFAFHYQRDIFRVNVVRNSGITKEESEFLDASMWEEAKKKGEDAIKKMIDDALENTSVTVVLIGAETAGRKYVNYEIEQSHRNRKGMLGVFIHRIRDPKTGMDTKGRNPFDDWTFKRDGVQVFYKTYDWEGDDGYNNLPKWIEAAAKDAGR